MTRSCKRSLAWLGLVALVSLSLLAVPATAHGAAGEQSGAKVDLNTAGEEELVTLPGIGPSYARRIVEYREKYGPFKKVEDLLNVRGIGDKTLEKLRDRVTVSKKK